MNDDVSLVVDCTGMRCPLPVITLARRIDEVAVGAIIGVTSDDPAAATDIPAWCRMRGHTALGTPAPAPTTPTAGPATTYLVRREG